MEDNRQDDSAATAARARLRVLVGGVSAVVLALAAPALAQAPVVQPDPAAPAAVAGQAAAASQTGAAAAAPGAEAAQTSTIAEVVVTAQKRSENLQKVPIAITAFTSQALAEKGITDVASLGKFAPSVEIVGTSPFSGSTQVLSAFIRGIGQNDFAFNLDPGVGVYVDGVYYARTVGAVVDLLDLDHIEILKGPQGTLFGRNTIGGAISVVTRDPGNTFSGQGEVTYGSYNRVDTRGAVDIPLIDDKLLAQVSFSTKSREGYFKYLTYPGTYETDADRFVRPDGTRYNTAGGNDDQNFRAKLKWNIAPGTTFRLTGDYMDANDEATPSQLITVKPGLKDIYNACISTAPAVLAAEGLGGPCNSPRGLPAAPGVPNQVLPPLGGINLDGDPGDYHLPFDNRFVPTEMDTSYSTGAGYSKVKTYGISGVFDGRINDMLAVKSITAYRNLRSRFGEDVDGTPIPMGDHAFTMNQTQVSQELQLLGSFFQDRLKTVTGAYYFHEQGGLTDFVHFAGGLLQIYGPNTFDTNSYAAFSQLDYKVTDRLGITGGIRYTDDQKEFQGGQRDLNSLAYKLGYPLSLHPDPNDPTLYFPTTDNHLSFSNVSFKAGVNYELADQVLTYATFSQGFKSGGWTTRATTPILTAPTFQPETADTYEGGLKSQFFDRTLQANFAVYYTDYKNLQVTVQDGVSPVTLNAAQSEIKGVEAELVYAPIRRLSIAATGSYTDAEYTQKDAGTTLGSMFVNTPKWAASLNVDYTIPAKTGGDFVLHGDYAFKSRIARDAENTPELISPDSNVVGALVSYRSAANNWHADVGVTNLTDDRFIITGQDQAGIGYIAGTYNRPREWYMRVGYKF